MNTHSITMSILPQLPSRYYNIYANLTQLLQSSLIKPKFEHKTENTSRTHSAHAKKQCSLLMPQQVSPVPFAPCRQQLWDAHHWPVTCTLLYWHKQLKKYFFKCTFTINVPNGAFIQRTLTKQAQLVFKLPNQSWPGLKHIHGQITKVHMEAICLIKYYQSKYFV